MPTESRSGVYHIHLDGMYRISLKPREPLRVALEACGFTQDSFCGHPPDYPSFEPQYFFTHKTHDRDEHQEIWRFVCALPFQLGFMGYAEAEYVKSDEHLPYHPFTEQAPPFQITRRRLDVGEWRKTELHLVMDKDKSDPQLIKFLLDAGLYGAYLKKQDRTFIVLTMQGMLTEMEPLIKSVKEYITTAGGAFDCTLKEEIAIGCFLFGPKPQELPEIAASVTYL